MKFKLDENLGTLGKVLLAADGHDVMTVADQSLQGEADEHIYEVCRKEARVLITLDRELWIVEPGRVRVHQRRLAEDGDNDC